MWNAVDREVFIINESTILSLLQSNCLSFVYVHKQGTNENQGTNEISQLLILKRYVTECRFLLLLMSIFLMGCQRPSLSFSMYT